MTVVMMRQMSLESSIEKSDQNSVDGMRQEVEGLWPMAAAAVCK